MKKFLNEFINIILGIACVLWFAGLISIHNATELYRTTTIIEVYTDETGAMQISEFDRRLIESEIKERIQSRKYAFALFKKMNYRQNNGDVQFLQDKNEFIDIFLTRMEVSIDESCNIKKNNDKYTVALIYAGLVSSNKNFSKKILMNLSEFLERDILDINSSFRMITLKNINLNFKFTHSPDNLKPFYPNKKQTFLALFVTGFLIFIPVIFRYRQQKTNKY